MVFIVIGALIWARFCSHLRLALPQTTKTAATCSDLLVRLV